MSTGGSFWDGSVFTPGFGVYSTSTSNQNKRNVGYNNSLNEGGNYSTTLGANFSTVLLGNFSTTLGVSMSSVVGANLPNTEGGKVELIIPWSVKWTRGWYDYDFKSCDTQVKVNNGAKVYTANSPDLQEYKGTPGGENSVVNKKADFAKQANEWVTTKNFVANDRVDTVVSDQQKLVERVEQVATADTKTVGGTHTIKAAAHSIQSTAGAFVKLSIGVTVKGANITLAGNVVNIG